MIASFHKLISYFSNNGTNFSYQTVKYCESIGASVTTSGRIDSTSLALTPTCRRALL